MGSANPRFDFPTFILVDITVEIIENLYIHNQSRQRQRRRHAWGYCRSTTWHSSAVLPEALLALSRSRPS